MTYKEVVLEKTALLPKVVYVNIFAVGLFYFKALSQELRLQSFIKPFTPTSCFRSYRAYFRQRAATVQESSGGRMTSLVTLNRTMCDVNKVHFYPISSG